MSTCAAVHLDWDIDEYISSVLNGPPATRHRAAQAFVNPHLGSIDVPATLVDNTGKILVWYLPDAVPDVHQVSLVSVIALNYLKPVCRTPY
jgi:hypothetical protein